MDGTGLKPSSYLSAISLAWTIQGMRAFNGDGKSDLLWRKTTSCGTHMWLMHGASAIGQGYTASQADSSWSIQGVGGFDGDGHSDILWRETAGSTYEWLMDGGAAIGTDYTAAQADNTWVIHGGGSGGLREPVHVWVGRMIA